MLNFFTDPYDGELLYSTIARFHYYSGSTSMKETLLQVFGDRNALPSVYVPCRLKHFANQFRNSLYSAESFIRNHTVLPYYLPFMDKQRKAKVIEAVKGNGGKSLFTMIGMAAGGICRKTGLYYCPECIVEDVEKYGEAYFHTLHQLEGVALCHIHNIFLKEYPLLKNAVSRIEFIRLELNKIQDKLQDNFTQHKYLLDKYIAGKMSAVAKAAEYIVTGDFMQFDNNQVYENIMTWLKSKGYITAKGCVRQKDLCKDFKNYYRDDFLNLFECNFEIGVDHSWICNIVRKPAKTMHPLRYILLALFFSDSPAPLFTQPLSQYKSTMEDAQRKLYDDAWDEKLKSIIKSGISLREIARQMKCDPKTIVKHAKDLGLIELLNTKMKIYIPKGNAGVANFNEAADDICRYIKEHPNCTRNEIRKNLSCQYMKLYKGQRELLFSILPEKIRSAVVVGKVDWEARDEHLLETVKLVYTRLLFIDKPIRISVTRLIKEMGYSSFRFYKEKLPKTRQYLESVAESLAEFQVRRIEYICKKLYEEKGIFEKWEVMRVAGLRNTASPKVLLKIDEAMANICGEILRGKNEKSNDKGLAISQGC